MNSRGLNFASSFSNCVGCDFSCIQKFLVSGKLFDVTQKLTEIVEQVFDMCVRGLKLYKGKKNNFDIITYSFKQKNLFHKYLYKTTIYKKYQNFNGIYLTRRLSGFEILNNVTLIFQKWLVSRHFANIFHYLNFSEEYL